LNFGGVITLPKLSEPPLKTKILHITFNMGIGGTEQVIRQIVENSDSKQFTHEILSIDGMVGPLGQELKENGIKVICTQRKPGTDFKLMLFIRQLIKSNSINVLHCHQYTPYFYGVLSAIGSGVKVIFTEHGRFFPDRHNFKRRFINPLLSLVTDHYTAISKSTADAVAEYEYISRKKIDVIYNGIKSIEGKALNRTELLNELGLSDGYRYIGTISRLEPIKNQAMMIKAFHQSLKEVHDLKLILIGDGAIKNDLLQLVKSLEIEQEVIFTGFINNPQKYINLFEIFLLSSFSEGTSMTLLEAMSLAVPCVVTDVGGNPEIVENNKTGFIVPSDDYQLLSNAIVDLLQNSNKSKTFGEDGRNKYLSNFTVSQMINKYHKLYLSK